MVQLRTVEIELEVKSTGFDLAKAFDTALFFSGIDKLHIHYRILGASEITAYLNCDCVHLYCDLHYIFAVFYETPST